jgi:phosphotransferase system enzyme I (PtsP)
VKVLRNSFNADACSIYEYNAEREELIMTATDGLNPKSVNKVALKPGDGVVGCCFKLRTIINIKSPDSHPGFKYIRSTGEEKFSSMLAVPLLSSGRKIGVLVIQRCEKVEFPHEAVTLARNLAPQLANLIISSGLINDLNRRSSAKATKRRGSFKLEGIPVNPGVVYGTAIKYKVRDVFADLDNSACSDVEAELKLLERAIAMTRENTLEFEKRALTMLSEADASIFNAHLLFLEDKMVMDSIRKEIIDNFHTVEFSTNLVYHRFEKKFLQLDDNTFKERLIDFKDVMRRLIESAQMIRKKPKRNNIKKADSRKQILVANELMPSDLLRMSIDKVVGIVCETGGMTSHVAILAKAFEIPALLGVKGVMCKVANDDKLVVDAHSGKLYINPDAKLAGQFESVINGHDEDFCNIGKTLTADGVRIKLKANISLLCETPLVKKYAADGIGLYRSEFMFMLRDYLPDEDIQMDIFSKIFASVEGAVTVRVLDAGADKQINCLNIPRMVNPALGPRGTRLLLEHPEFLHAHLRAILRAGQNGRLNILFPMISSLQEICAVKLLLGDVVRGLRSDKLEFCNDYRIGVMLEVPSVYVSLDRFLEEVDFISIGTNDLLQYMYAVDRLYYEEEFINFNLEPGFLRVLGEIAAKVNAADGKFLTVCGEIVSNPLAAPILIGAGISAMSLPPRLIPLIREVIAHFSMAECQEFFRRAIAMEFPNEVVDMMRQAMVDRGVEKTAALLVTA